MMMAEVRHWLTMLFNPVKQDRLQRIDKALDHITKTTNGVRADHGLNQLVDDIEAIRLRGAAALKAGADKEEE